MNKKLVAVAVAGLLAAPLAAQAQTANVTLYGRLNLTMEMVNGKQVDGSNPNAYRVSTNSSRFGFRGSEALGGGLSAIFQMESSANVDSGGGTIAARDTFVGLQGTWGTVKLGNMQAPYDDIHPIFGNVPTLTTSILSTAALWAQGSQTKDQGGFDARMGNTLRYDSPVMAGFVGAGSISAIDTSNGSLAQQSRHAYIMGLGGFYRNGPFTGGIAYESNQKVRGPTLDDNAVSIAANWNFGVVKVGGVYERLDYDTTSGSLKRNFWAISATAPIGPGEFYAQWGDAGDGTGGATPCIGGIGTAACSAGQLKRGDGTGATNWSLSYTYALSKRTLSYLGYVQTKNDDNAAYNFNINPYNVANGGRAGGLVLGVVHFF